MKFPFRLNLRMYSSAFLSSFVEILAEELAEFREVLLGSPRLQRRHPLIDLRYRTNSGHRFFCAR